jgi:hypothetical protein
MILRMEHAWTTGCQRAGGGALDEAAAIDRTRVRLGHVVIPLGSKSG